MSEVDRDQTALRALVERYSYAVDARNEALLASCFAEQGTLTPVIGTPQSRTVIGNRAIAADIVKSISRFPTTIHQLCNPHFDIDGETTARGDTFGITHLFRPPPDDHKLIIRGIRYQDRFCREGAEWRILERRHLRIWEAETTAQLQRSPQFEIT